MIKAFNESLRSLDCPKAFLGKGLNAKYGSSSSLPRSQPYTDQKSLSLSKIKEKFQQATKTVPTQKGKIRIYTQSKSRWSPPELLCNLGAVNKKTNGSSKP